MKISSVKEYQDFVKKHNLPLEKMRFALERKYDKRWFYLYYDPTLDEWIVAKNKDDGTTAVRYRGPSEATACQILFDKMEDEARKRGYLGGYSTANPKSRKKGLDAPTIIMWVTIVLVIGIAVMYALLSSSGEGYYVKRASGQVYYYMDDNYYYYDDTYDDWYYMDSVDFTYDDYEEDYDYYDRYDFEREYGPEYMTGEDDWFFSNTTYYDDYHSSSSSSSSDWSSDDYSSWDSSDTDWGSDW